MRNMRFDEALSQADPKSDRKTKPTSRVTLQGYGLRASFNDERHERPFECAWTVERGLQMQNAKPLPARGPDASVPTCRDSHCLLPTRDGQLMSRSQPGLCTPVDIRSKKAQKFSLFLTFRPARREFPMAKPDPQIVSCQADQTALVVFRSKQNTMWDAEPQNSHIEFRLLFTI